MPSDIEFGVASMFRDATMQSVIFELRNDGDWERFNAIKDEAKQRTKDEVDGFERNREGRLAAARKNLIDKAGALTFEHPAPFGADKFNKTAIERQAVTKIFNDHHAALLTIKTEEADAYAALKDDIQARENTRSVARDTLTPTTDRHSGEDRRVPSRDR